MLHERFQQVDKAQLARRFGAAARHYDAHARFQQEVGQALLDLMPDRPVGSELTVCVYVELSGHVAYGFVEA